MDFYVGSTRSDLNTRMLSHKCPSNSCKSKIILKRNHYKFEIIEEVNEDNRYDIELFYINQMSTLKQRKPPLKIEDRRQNKLELDKKYWLAHLEVGKIYNANYYEQFRRIKKEEIKPLS